MTAVYEWFDADDRLLYVGISEHVARRAGEHEQVKQWWADVARSRVTHYSTRAEAQEVERVLIRHLKPLYNIVHNERRVQRAVLSESSHLREYDDEARVNMSEQTSRCLSFLRSYSTQTQANGGDPGPALWGRSPVAVRKALAAAVGEYFSLPSVKEALRVLRRETGKEGLRNREAMPGGDWVFGSKERPE